MFIVQMVMTLLAFVLALLGAVRPPHPIFQEAPPPVEDEVPDLEAPAVADDEDPEDRKKRFRDLGAEDCETNFSGTGVMNFTAREKKLLLQRALEAKVENDTSTAQLQAEKESMARAFAEKERAMATALAALPTEGEQIRRMAHGYRASGASVGTRPPSSRAICDG